jgi:hypothetical protein
MAVTHLVRRVAAGAAVPVFVLQGAHGGRPGVARSVLDLEPGVQVVTSPRHAAVLVLAGALPPGLDEPASLVHDAMPHPRATVVWGAAVPPWAAELADAPVDEGADVVGHIGEAYHALMTGARRSDEPVVSDTGRTPWLGIGPYGHGGSGMTGGTPYGRPLPDRDDDLRDGLKLDALTITIGPFFPSLPTGLTMDVVVQGDVVQQVSVRPNPFAADGDALWPSISRLEWGTATVADVELARVRHHLFEIANTARLLSLDALARRVLAAAVAEPSRLHHRGGRLLRWLRRLPVALALPGDDLFVAEQPAGHGFLDRAAGRAIDARTSDPAYLDLGFTALTARGGPRGRWALRLAEAEQSLAIAAHPASTSRTPHAVVEVPWPVAGPILDALPTMLSGLEWGDAIAEVATLGLDLRTSAAAMASAA